MSEDDQKCRVLLLGASSDIGLALNQKYLNAGFLRLRFIANHACEFIPRLARDWAASNVLINVVRSGVTNTKGHSTFSDRNLADCIFWLGSEQNTYVTGQVTAISGGE